MSDATGVGTRSPADIGYLPWVLHRASALVLVVLLAVHVAVQAYNYAAPYRWGIYGGLLDLTLAVVLLHGFLGVRAAVVETTLSDGVKRGLVWVTGFVALGLFLARVLA